MNPNHPPSPADRPEVAQLRALDELLEDPAPQGTALPGRAQGDCPAPGDWVWLAIGEASQNEIVQLMAHAAGCPHCAARMRRGLNLLSENASLEEDAAVAALLSTPGTRWRSLAAQLAATPHHGTHGRRARIYLWAGAALAASLLLVGGLSFWQHATHSP